MKTTRFIFMTVFIFLISITTSFAAKTDWTYEQFPILKAGQKFDYPMTIEVGNETMQIKMHPKSGTHLAFGIDQMYLSQNPSKRILIKQDVKLSDPRLIGQWIKLTRGQVYHYKKQNQVIAIFTDGYSDSHLKDIEKNFVSLKDRQSMYLQGSNPNLQSLSLLSSFLYLNCSVAEAETASSDPSVQNPPVRRRGSNARAGSTGGNGAIDPSEVSRVRGSNAGPGGNERSIQSAEAATSLGICLASKAASHLKQKGENVINTAGGALSTAANGIAYLREDPMGAANLARSYLYDTGASVVNGVAEGASAVYNYGAGVVKGQNNIWEDVNYAVNQSLEFGKKLIDDISANIPGFELLDPAVANAIVCEAGGTMIAEGSVRAFMSLMSAGSGSAVNAAMFANTLRKIVGFIRDKMPVFNLISSASLTGKIKSDLTRKFFGGDLDERQLLAKLPPDDRGGANSNGTASRNNDRDPASANGNDGGTDSGKPGDQTASTANDGEGSNTEISREEKLAINGELDLEDRPDAAARALGLDPDDLSDGQREAVKEAHLIGVAEGRGYGTYTQEDILKKTRILKNAGFSKDQTRILMEDGITGTAPVKRRDRSIPFTSDDVVESFDDIKDGTTRIRQIENNAISNLRGGGNANLAATELQEASQISLNIASTQTEASKARAYLEKSLTYRTKPVITNEDKMYQAQLEVVERTNYFSDLTPDSFNDLYPVKGDYLQVQRAYNELTMLNFMTSGGNTRYPNLSGLSSGEIRKKKEAYKFLLDRMRSTAGMSEPK